MGGDSTDNSRQPKGHLEVTLGHQRDPELHIMTVTEMEDISPTVKKVVLSTAVTPVTIQFKAGQWLDMYIPGVSTVTGFSMTSSPLHLQRTGQLELAIQYSTEPPALWIHTQCAVGSEVSIRIGGDFFFDATKTGDSDRILFLAGGVGINPLVSMINQIQDERMENPSIQNRFQTYLLFSAKKESELLFKERFESLAGTDAEFKCDFFVTKKDQETGLTPNQKSNVKVGRIGLDEIREAVEYLGVKGAEAREKLRVYICGPSCMIQDMELTLKSLNITSNIFFESWWRAD